MGAGLVSNCVIDGGSITSVAGGESKNVGGIVGYVEGGEISGCTVKNLTITGDKYVGGIVGTLNQSLSSAIGNTAIDCIIIGNTNANQLFGRVLAGATERDNIATNVTVKPRD